jgi:hypothetical protein
MKVSKEKLKQMIKEELEKVMKEGDLEEIKGAAGSALAAMDKGRDLSRNTSNVKMTVDDVAYGSDEPVVGDWEDDDHIPPASKEEVISSTLERLGIDPVSKLGMDIADQLRSAAEKVLSRTAGRHSDGDRLASRERALAGDQPVKSGPRKGMRSISTNKALKRDIKAGLGLEESEELEEIKGPAARALAGGGVNIGSEIDNVRFGSDEPAEDYDLSDQIPPGSKDEFINGVLERLGIDPSSELGMDIAAQLRSAAEKQQARAKERGARVMGNTSDALARRQPVRVTKKGKPHKDDIKLRKYQIGTNLDRMQGTGDDSFDYEPEEELEEAKAHGGAREKAEHDKKKMEEAQVEELRESFRRFTKLPKDTLKD